MSSITELKKEMEVVVVLGQLVQVYEQVYVAKMQRLRDSVLATRQYTEGLHDLYNELHRAYGNEVAKAMKSRTKRKWLRLTKKDEQVAVLLSTSQRISSEINMKVFNAFWDYISAYSCKAVIVGQRGRQMYVQRGGDVKKVEFFDVENEEEVKLEELEPILEKLRQYRDVKLFYARYISLITQLESQSDLGEGTVAQKKDGEQYLVEPQSTQQPFIAEPGVKPLVDYFESEIFGSLLRQSYSESHLAHVGSRITALEAAVGNVGEKVEQLKRQERKLIKRKKNRKQLAALAGMSFWGVR